MSERARRIGLNEAVFRAVNEEIERLAGRFALTGEPLDLICECGDAGCAERVRIAHPAYLKLRSDPRTFAIVPGHDAPDVEVVVAHENGYDVVRKRSGEPAAVAEATAPPDESRPDTTGE
jgi:hypothetical protein